VNPDPEALASELAQALDPVVLAIGDLHDGSTTGLSTRRNCRTVASEWLIDTFEIMIAQVLKRAANRPFFVLGGGDVIEGHHHNSKMVWGTKKEQRDDAIELLQPLAVKATKLYGVLGTEAHAGDNAEDDKQVMQELGATMIDHHQRIRFGKKYLSWAHHGMTAGNDPDTSDGGMLLAIKKYYALYKALTVEWAENGAIGNRPTPASLLISHHTHRSPHPVMRHGIYAALCGCWQLQTPHGAKIAPRLPVDIGVLIWEPERSAMPERLLFRPPEDKLINAYL